MEQRTNRIEYRSGRGVHGGVAGAAGPLLAAIAVPLLDSLRAKEEHYFRHTVRLRGGTEEVVHDDDAAYQVGDCVAFRTEPDLLVPALPGACDAKD